MLDGDCDHEDWLCLWIYSTVLSDDTFLMQGLVHARQLIGDQLRAMLATKNWTQGSMPHFKSEMMYPIISTGNLELVKKYLGS